MSDNPSRITRNQPICPYFARRECRRGRLCPNLHIISIDREKPNDKDAAVKASHTSVPQLSRDEESLSGCSAEPTKSSSNASNAQPCRHYFQKGWCSFGEKCRYSHANPKPGHFQDEESEFSVNIGWQERSNEDNRASGQLQPTSRKRVDDRQAVHSSTARDKRLCKFYKSGSCTKGQRCNFWHPTTSERSCRDECSQVPVTTSVTSPRDGEEEPTSVENTIHSMRKTELHQLRKRYPKAIETVTADGGTGYQITFAPTDPDWPYDVKEVNMEVIFPINYPQENFEVRLVNNTRMPETVQRVVTELIEEWVVERHRTMIRSGKTELMFRPFLVWLDKKLEDLFTEALKEFRREMMAAAAGVQFISARQLQKELYGSASEEPHPGTSSDDQKPAQPEINSSPAPAEKLEENQPTATFEDQDENKENSGTVTVNVGKRETSSEPLRRGTEVTLLGLQLLDGAATLMASNVSLIVACHRCTNTTEMKTPVSRLNSVSCGYCHASLMVKFNATLAHQFSSVIGFVDLESCDAFDLVLADTQFNVGCINCSKEMKMESVPPGPPCSTWCLHCHQKLTVAVNSVRFLKLAPSGQLDVGKACQVAGSKPVKAVRDPAIQEGKPLPDNGTCSHFKKSFRWLRFPCCGKAYPCDKCHNEKELDHVMKFANRMICGYCAREQPYASERPCVSCQSSMTSRATAHWEGGTGCRDKIKMSRNDDKKYTNSLKTVSKSSAAKTDPSKKVTKLRHVV